MALVKVGDTWIDSSKVMGEYSRIACGHDDAAKIINKALAKHSVTTDPQP